MSEQRKKKNQKSEAKQPVNVAEDEQPSTSKTPAETGHIPNVRCTRSVLVKNVRPLTKDSESKIIEYLDRNKDFMESYVMKNVPLEQMQEWVIKKVVNRSAEEPSTSTASVSSATCSDTDVESKKLVFMDLVRKLQGNTNEHSVVWELARFICTSIGVNSYRVYKLFPEHSNFVQYLVDKNETFDPIQPVRAHPERVRNIIKIAKRGTSLRSSKGDSSGMFPLVSILYFDLIDLQIVNEANHVLYQPILAATGKTVYVIEMFRTSNSFTDMEEEISSHFTVWGSLMLHYCNLYTDKRRERGMSDFLLDVVKAIFEEMVSLDQLIKRILEFAQRLVSADRASLFLVDYRNYELVSTVFDLKCDSTPEQDMERKEIRMPINRGIAGHVALSGETMNIPDAYSDVRFNREVDEVTGYKTESILCMPIKVKGRVIGVVQMVNKRDESKFDHEDEMAFEIFSTFFGLALHHARLYDKIIMKEQKYRVALEVLSYHNTCKEHEVDAILTDPKQLTVNINDFYFDPYLLNDTDKCKAAIEMFHDLFDISKFDIATLTRFILTVKKNYRTVPYHNFDHGWSVAHAMYVLLKSDTRNRFDYIMRVSLFVASLCHDLDHRGYTNKYMSETASPLAAMYTTSTLEHHHFNITVTILQQDGHNIFSYFTSEEYKDILRYIRQCILATDLAVFFPNLEKLKQIYAGKTKHRDFNWAVPAHSDLAMALSMTAADLSASAKPWDIQIKTVKVIFEEFYEQGDKERAAGKTPIPMMDRNKPQEQSTSQVGFLSQICVPCYSMLYKVLPSTKPMYVMALKNLNNWKQRASHIKRKLETGSPCIFGEMSDSEIDDNDLSDQISLEIPSESDEETDEDVEELSSDEYEDVEEALDISSKIQAAWQNLKPSPSSWDEESVQFIKDFAKQSVSTKEDDKDVVVANKAIDIEKKELE